MIFVLSVVNSLSKIPSLLKKGGFLELSEFRFKDSSSTRPYLEFRCVSDLNCLPTRFHRIRYRYVQVYERRSLSL